MNNYHKELIPDDRHPLIQLLILIALVLLGGAMGASAFALLLEIQGKSFDFVMDYSLTDSDENWWLLMIFQGLTSAFMFSGAALVYLTLFERVSLAKFFRKHQNLLQGVLICSGMTFTFMVVNTIFIEWNQNVVLPEFLREFESIARSKEDQLAEVTEFLTSFNSKGQLGIALFVIAVLPAVGEELLFRGVLQPTLHRMTENPHVAIWLTGLIFGAIHMQFYGTVPRALLGVVFGYMFYYSGNLLYPMIGHFINNGLSILLVYMANNQIIEQDLEEVESVPFYQQLIFLVLFIFAMMAFIRHFNPKTQSDG